MMICKADFEELFPDLFQPEPNPDTPRMAKPANARCIARWEDDGGRSLPARQRGRMEFGRISQRGSNIPELARAGAMGATMPVAAALAAAWTMLSAYGPMKTDRHDTL